MSHPAPRAAVFARVRRIMLSPSFIYGTVLVLVAVVLSPRNRAILHY